MILQNVEAFTLYGESGFFSIGFYYQALSVEMVRILATPLLFPFLLSDPWGRQGWLGLSSRIHGWG